MSQSTRVLMVVVSLLVVSPAQFQSNLTTTYAQNSSCFGNIFDVTAATDVTICSFDVHMALGMSTLNVFAVTGGGSWNQPGVIGTPSAWTLIGTATVMGRGAGSPTPLNLNLGFSIPMGATQGFAIEKTVSLAPNMFFTIGTAYGTPLASSADLAVFEGGGLCAAPGGFNPNSVRNWNGTIYYELGLAPSCSLPVPPTEWQINQSGGSLTLNGIPDPGSSAAINQASFVGTTESLDLASTNVGLPWELLVLVPGQGQGLSVLNQFTPGGQTINVDLVSPSLVFLNMGNLSTTSFPAASFSIPFSVPTPVMVGAQMVVLDPGQLDGFSLSHTANYSAEICNLSQNFDLLPAMTNTPPPGWTNSVGGAGPWTVFTGLTIAGGTGPLAGAFSPPNYMYVFSNLAFSTFVMDTCAFDTTALTSFTLNFRLSRLGMTIGTLNIYQDDGSGTFSTLLTTYTGPVTTDWTPESIPFVATSPTVAFRFSYNHGFGFMGDIAIDDFSVQ